MTLHQRTARMSGNRQRNCRKLPGNCLGASEESRKERRTLRLRCASHMILHCTVPSAARVLLLLRQAMRPHRCPCSAAERARQSAPMPLHRTHLRAAQSASQSTRTIRSPQSTSTMPPSRMPFATSSGAAQAGRVHTPEPERAHPRSAHSHSRSLLPNSCQLA